MPRLLVFGTGSVGGLYTYIIDRGGGEATCVCRSNYAEVKAHGIRIESSILGNCIANPHVVRSVDEALSSSQQPFDFVVNGLGIEERYHRAFPGAPIISGVAYAPTTQTSPGVFLHSEMERLHLGLYDTDRSSTAIKVLESFVSLIRRGGGTAILENDIQIERWRKIVANGAINPICALSRCRDGQLMKVAPLAFDLLKKVMLEIVAVAEAEGYGHVVSPETVEAQLARSLGRPFPGVQPSMMADALNGRQLEVEAIVGRIVEIGRSKQVEIPRLETLFVLLQGLDTALQIGVDGEI
ncbi:hypothetical protein LTR10_024171 [Elasticomyces elasticus]|uniref:2-dehydropantoate 2-reductase n=1 Tax=Exophiala sideris TaxID=1016849 RepID=A0ABR0JA10_9EURO|nr:hypothetical protein LTR10_024171 [Elasticomyces elasticus]KAK5026191.1 hypothetical protein LTS07_007716 [Exophiala sideris]KAK5032445.1 hypothetical protein LTR13_007268 [Exophiala sideris]KAK5059601.1 hypothetical protein LTR69_006190 [Exophiala sideris]KAK5178116.1 hypothetical protein LTR44_009422 [Eurotiomycetes sp. CCFEE 6388]